jgi:fructokinase
VHIVSIGEILWDVIGGEEHLGGAPLNFAAHARKLGHDVFLVSAVGDDERGSRALEAVRRLGISTDFLQVIPGKRTGTAQVELDPSGKPMFRIVRPAAYDFVRLTADQRRRIARLQPDWIYVGTLFHLAAPVLTQTLQLLEEVPAAKRIYDVNLREDNWHLSVVEQLASRAHVMKLSDSEAEFLDASLGVEDGQASVRHFCERWCDQFKCRTVCVTLGERGCAIYHDDKYAEFPGFKVKVADTVGAGDAFASGLIHGMDTGWPMERCARFANAVAALVASRSGAIPDWTVEEAVALMDDAQSS